MVLVTVSPLQFGHIFRFHLLVFGECIDFVLVTFQFKAGFILLMEEILHHLGCINPVNNGINYISIGAGFHPSTVGGFSCCFTLNFIFYPCGNPAIGSLGTFGFFRDFFGVKPPPN